MRIVRMKQITRVWLILVIATTVGCDPGFTVRQFNPRPQWQSAAPEVPQHMSIEVSKFHALIGSGYYTPKIRITNMTKLPVAIEGVELVTSQGIYHSSLRQNEDFRVKLD